MSDDFRDSLLANLMKIVQVDSNSIQKKLIINELYKEIEKNLNSIIKICDNHGDLTFELDKDVEIQKLEELIDCLEELVETLVED